MTTKTNPVAGVDHSELSDEEKKKRGIETEEEAIARADNAVQQEEKKMKKPKAKKAKTTVTKKVKAAKKPKVEAKPKAKKSKAKKETKRAYHWHEGTKDDPKTGQKGKKQGLERDDLNEREKEVLTAVNRAKEVSLKDLVDRTMPTNISAAKRNSWTRNALRRLVREGFIKRAGRGNYKAA